MRVTELLAPPHPCAQPILSLTQGCTPGPVQHHGRGWAGLGFVSAVGTGDLLRVILPPTPCSDLSDFQAASF